MTLEKIALDVLRSGQYYRAGELYEALILDQPENFDLYCWLGLAYLLQDKEEEAQMTWAVAMMDRESDQLPQWTEKLVQILEEEAQHQQAQAQWFKAQLVRQHIQSIQPFYFKNSLQLFQLLFKTDTLTAEALEDLNLIQIFSTTSAQEHIEPLDSAYLTDLLNDLLQADLFVDWLPDLVEAGLPLLIDPLQLFPSLMFAASNAAHLGGRLPIAIRYSQICLQIIPHHSGALNQQASFYHQGGNLTKVLEIAEALQQQADTLEDQVNVNFLMINTFLRSGGQWYDALPYVDKHHALLYALMEQPFKVWNRSDLAKILHAPFPLPYIGDRAARNRFFQNRVLSLCQKSICTYASEYNQAYLRSHSHRQNSLSPPRKLKIGYLSHCLRQHSVGWLARWLFQHHDRDQFEIHAYFVMYGTQLNDPLQSWYVHQADYSYQGKRDGLEIAQAIHEHEVDILIDLDSATADVTCEVVAVKPAPIQATWLGWDASGMTAMDYYLADAYALPDQAQTYYQEKLWRLPHTYLGVDGFEIGTPNLKRKDLEIPGDAIVYFSAQSGYKRHPDTVRLQIEILKTVPNSYFLVKDIIQDYKEAQNFFEDLSETLGVSTDRLRFLSAVDSEMTHRANLAIADVVLDTYPYNGATTTLETLWMGIPLVTRVGQQFSARNSYTFMMNAGITEGIAWTDDEYVEWGIRLGTDEQMRKEVAWKLRQSRKSAPLWNGQQFTRDMEAAYRQMWERYCHG